MSFEDRWDAGSQQTFHPEPTPGMIPYQRWMDSFRDLSSTLIQTIESKENDFLEIGHSIQDISRLSRDMTQSVTELVQNASGQGFRGEVEKFSQEFKELFEICEAVDPLRGGGLLLSIGQTIQELQDRMGGFRQIIKRLRVLAISTRIESSRLGSEGRGFSTLADDVEQLATKTAEYSKQVQAKTKVLQTMVENAQKKTASVSGLESGQGEMVLHDVQQSFDSLQRVQAEAEHMSATLSRYSEGIASNVGEVISSVQFHDIIRQQIAMLRRRGGQVGGRDGAVRHRGPSLEPRRFQRRGPVQKPSPVLVLVREPRPLHVAQRDHMREHQFVHAPTAEIAKTAEQRVRRG